MITSNNQPLQMHQLSHIYDTNYQITGIKLTFENFKHNYNQQPFSLEIYRQSMICPVQLLSDYLVLCGSRPGAIFISHLQYRVTHLLLNFRGLFGIVVWTLQNTNLINLELALLPMQLRTDILMRKFVH